MTPAVIVQAATMPEEQVFDGTLAAFLGDSELTERLATSEVPTFAIVGVVAAFRLQLGLLACRVAPTTEPRGYHPAARAAAR